MDNKVEKLQQKLVGLMNQISQLRYEHRKCEEEIERLSMDHENINPLLNRIWNISYYGIKFTLRSKGYFGDFDKEYDLFNDLSINDTLHLTDNSYMFLREEGGYFEIFGSDDNAKDLIEVIDKYSLRISKESWNDYITFRKDSIQSSLEELKLVENINIKFLEKGL